MASNTTIINKSEYLYDLNSLHAFTSSLKCKVRIGNFTESNTIKWDALVEQKDGSVHQIICNDLKSLVKETAEWLRAKYFEKLEF